MNRVKTGIAPSGRKSKIPAGKGSSKFHSDEKHKLSFNTAYNALSKKNENKTRVKGAANIIKIPDAGIKYYGYGREEKCNDVQLDIQPVNDKEIRINSMYPV